MTERRQLLLAYAIAEWASALEHLRAVNRTRPMPMSSITEVEHDLNRLTGLWQLEGYCSTVWRGNLSDWIIAEARAYLTEHQTELDQLLAAEGG